MIILVLGSTVMLIVLSVFLPMIQVITSLSAAG
jgi:type II secretory pathway component PulF